jgi:hypothetical protein
VRGPRDIVPTTTPHQLAEAVVSMFNQFCCVQLSGREPDDTDDTDDTDDEACNTGEAA